jgi:hypothetical protein
MTFYYQKIKNFLSVEIKKNLNPFFFSKYNVCFFLLLHFKPNQLRFSEKGSPAPSWYFKQNKKNLKKF